jgi:transcriptional regulator with XRE-family HTH domain
MKTEGGEIPLPILIGIRRTQIGLTQKGLARLISCESINIELLENGKEFDLSFNQYAVLSSILGLDMTEMVLEAQNFLQKLAAGELEGKKGPGTP